jgi:hypothetical protein
VQTPSETDRMLELSCFDWLQGPQAGVTLSRQNLAVPPWKIYPNHRRQEWFGLLLI